MKKPKRARCPECGNTFEPTLHRGRELLAGGAGLILGGLATENFFGGLLIGGLCYIAAHMADQHYALRCTSCGRRATWIEEEPPREEAAPEVRQAA